MEFQHTTVLLKETVDHLVTDPEGIYADGTLGGGGHSYEICTRLTGAGRLIGIDQDADALAAAAKRLEPFSDRVTLIRSNYRAMKQELLAIGITGVNGIVLDLGVSSYQIDDPERGFTYMKEDALLDMRMDRRQSRTAADVLQDEPEEEICRILRDYGEERYASSIARHIAAARQKAPIRTVGELNDIIRASIPAKARMTGGHPSKRTFQALRIEVNGELDVLRDSIDEMIDLLLPGGRLCIITFHSLEDRIVKTHFRKNENPCTCPPKFPVCVCGKVSKGRVVTKKPILPGTEELEANSRSGSAKLRVFERN